MTATMDDAAPAESVPEQPRRDRGLGVFLTLASLIGLYASAVLTVDKISLLQAKVDGVEKTLNCDLSAFVSCSDVVSSDQSSAFGFPNTLIGVAAFAALAAFAAVLASGAGLPRWIWAGLQVGVLFGIGFVTWLQYQAVFDIGKLCPWCMVVWAVMIPTFVLVTARVTGWRWLKNWAGLVIALWIVAICAVIWFQFGSTLWA